MDKIKKGVRLDHISKIYQDPKTGKNFYAVKDTSLTIEPGSFVKMCIRDSFEGDCPARSAVQVGALPKGALVEIEAIAVKK